MKPTPLSIIAFAASALASHAAVSVVHEYHLGEAGSLSNTTTQKTPQDSVGSAHFTNAIGGATATIETTGVYAPGSTAYLGTATTANQGWYGADFSAVPTDNFAYGIFARAAVNDGTTQGAIWQLGNNTTNGMIKITLNTNGWGASAHGVTWIGGNNGNAGSFTADQWVHLALVRQSGTTTFYIDGASQGTWGGTPAAPTASQGHMSVTPGGSPYFSGHLDEARVVTFTASDSTTDILNGLQGVPEPSSTALLGLGAMALLFRRKL